MLNNNLTEDVLLSHSFLFNYLAIMDTLRILVLGASGYIGQNLTKKLSEQGHIVIAAARKIEWLQEQNWPNVECRHVNLYEPDSIPPALWKVDIVYYLVHGMNDSVDFFTQERLAVKNLRKALRHSAVKQIIFLGALQPKTGDPTPHLQARQITGEILRTSGIPVTEFRAPLIIGPGSAAFEVMRDMVYNLYLLTPPRWVRSKTSPIALENLLTYLTDILHHASADHRIFEVAGPEYLSYQEMFQRFIKITGKRRLLIPIPLPTKLVSIYWLNLITSVPTTTARALIEGLKHDLPADAQSIQQLIPQKLIDYDTAVRNTLKREEETVTQSTHWGYDPEARSRWRPGYGFYPKQAGSSLETTASKEALWYVIQQVGGKEGYFYANYLWKTRGWMDDLIGGKRYYGRPERENLQVGDQIDSWKVITLKPMQRLVLMFGMKAPGLGRLNFSIKERDSKREVDIRAWWHPAGFSGLLYWFIMMPAHLFIFKGMARRIVKLAEKHDGIRR